MSYSFSISDCPLGKKVPYPDLYDRSLLFAIPRQWSREKTFSFDLQNGAKLPDFLGVDVWNDYEFSFLDAQTKQRNIYFLQILIPSDSEFLVESKSFKLYLFSFANEYFYKQEIIARIQEDISAIIKAKATVRLFSLDSLNYTKKPIDASYYFKLDNIAPCSEFQLNPNLLKIANKEAKTQAFWLKNFRSNCLVSGKPDWAEITIDLNGLNLDPISLYRYLVSFRLHLGIHEQCIERIFFDLYELATPSKLCVKGFFTRRGGLDINPIRVLDKSFDSSDDSIWQRRCCQ